MCASERRRNIDQLGMDTPCTEANRRYTFVYAQVQLGDDISDEKPILDSRLPDGSRVAEDVNFWRDFLSGGEPRIILQFGLESAIIISTTMMSSEIEWPGIPKEFAKPFENVEYDDNLFTAAQAQEFEGEESEPLPGEDEVDEEEPQDEG